MYNIAEYFFSKAPEQNKPKKSTTYSREAEFEDLFGAVEQRKVWSRINQTGAHLSRVAATLLQSVRIYWEQ